MPVNPFKSGRGFSFEDVIRRRYALFRSRERYGLATLVDVVWLTVVVAMIILVLSVFLVGMIAALFAAPFIILGIAIARRISPPRRRVPEGAVIDAEFERK